MKTFKLLTLSILSLIFISSCTIRENFDFNDDFSGHYSFQFDYSALLELDSSGSASSELDKGYLEMEDELKKIEGITNIIIISDNESGNVLVSYDFNSIEDLNKANFNKESNRYNKFFSIDGKKVKFKVDFSTELEEYKDPEIDDTELLENIESMINYKMIFKFSKKIKTIQLDNFEQIDNYTLSYTLSKESVLNPSQFLIKIK